MNYLKDKKILLIVCGSIAAYKAAYLVRAFIKKSAQVKVVMTPSAEGFISPLTLATLSKNECLIHFEKENGLWNNHVDLGLWADLMVIAPASANTIAKMATGLCDNLALACYLSAKCPVFFATGMDLDMYKHPATQKNISTLKEYGNIHIPSEYGELASGLVGEGRMAEPDNIAKQIENYFTKEQRLIGIDVLVSAGPTFEKLDPVRYIGNFSSGKMGFAIAEKLMEEGANVTLVTGPTKLDCSNNINRIDVVSAHEMLESCLENFKDSSITIMSAAVADYTPLDMANEKIKKRNTEFNLALTKTVDILKTLGASKTDDQTLIGFALETQNEVENAIKKINTKNLDFIVLNSLKDKGAGFGVDTNKITIIDKLKNKEAYPLMNKKDVAGIVVNKAIDLCLKK
jgi:phosphopantothenoylcysteine decarboxylase/phosphopantothenate--cysteine ligase